MNVNKTNSDFFQDVKTINPQSNYSSNMLYAKFIYKNQLSKNKKNAARALSSLES